MRVYDADGRQGRATLHPSFFTNRCLPGHRPAARLSGSSAQKLCGGMHPAARQGTTTLEHGKLRGSCRARAEPGPIDLGDEPPLSVDGRDAALIDKRGVSARWYAGTILTGLCGAALMGGAVYAALDGEAYFASIPERLEALRGSLAPGDRSAIRKTDRLQSQAETHAARQVLRVSTTTKIGEREVVRMRPFVRVAANLSLSTSELSANIPSFNPARLLASANSGTAAAADETPTVDDAEISFVMRDLAPALPRAKIAGAVPIEQIMARVRE